MNHVNTLVLHQLRLGELDSAAETRVRAHLSECALCASRAAHQRAVRTEFQRMPMPAALEPRPSWWERARAWLPVAALVPVALVAAFVVKTGPATTPMPSPHAAPPAALVESAPSPAPTAGPEGSGPSAPAEPTAAPAAKPAAPAAKLPAPSVTIPEVGAAAPDADVTHTKGLTPRLEAWVQAGTSSRPLYLGETVGAGTKLQLRYDPRGRRFVTLAGRDSNGIVEVYGTIPGGEAGLTSAPFALTLDDSKGEQAFFAICTDERPTTDAVMSAVKHNPVRMNGAAVSSVVVRKD